MVNLNATEYIVDQAVLVLCGLVRKTGGGSNMHEPSEASESNSSESGALNEEDWSKSSKLFIFTHSVSPAAFFRT